MKATAGLALSVGVAGCSRLGGGGNGGGSDSPTGAGTDTETATDTAQETTEDTSPVSFQRRWEERVDTDGVVSSQNFGADATARGVFFGAEWGFAALGLADGSRMWGTDEWDGFHAIHADSNGVVAYTRSLEVVSFDPADGTERWRASTTGSEDAVYSSALTPSYVVAESADGLVVYDRSSGDVAGEIPLERSPNRIVATDDVVVVFTSGSVTAYDAPGGSERWSTDTVMRRGVATGDGRLLGTTFDESGKPILTAFDRATGEERWAETAADVGLGSRIAVDGDVAAFVAGGSFGNPSTVHAHDLEGGSKLWSKPLGQVRRGFAVIDSGTVISPAVTEDNRSRLRAYDARSGEQLAATSGGLGITTARAVDRVYLGIELSTVTAIGF